MSVNMNKPLDLSDGEANDEADELLEGLQGNILRSHGRNEAVHLFINFGTPSSEQALEDSVRSTRAWIGNIDITTAKAEEGNKDHVGTFQSLLISSEGYRFLDEKRPKDGSFRDGMRDRGDKLNDASPNTWENDYRYEDEGKQVHALLIIADNIIDNMDSRLDEINASLDAFGAKILVVEKGHQKLREGKAIEHFGYRDGVSQPKLIISRDEPVNENAKFKQQMPLKRVLEEDRSARGHFGSYLVFRKLEQDVDSFEQAVNNIATKLNLTPDYIGAQAVGRFKNGTPLALSDGPNPDYDATGEGLFDYDDDDDGDKCPLHAHIRKTNPRNSLGFFTDLIAREKKRRIVRRGITYGERPGKVGLIFICYQADIKDQFEFMQRRWANGHSFSKRGTGLDPVIGQDGGPQEANDHPNWTKGYGSKDRERVGFGEHVRLRGGEYFFAPSIAGLKNLASG